MVEELKERQKRICIALAKAGANLAKKNAQGQTPFDICLNNENTQLAYLFLESIDLSEHSDLLFLLGPRMGEIKFQELMVNILKQNKPNKEALNTVNDQGYTPFLFMLKSFLDKYNDHLIEVGRLVNPCVALYGKEIEKYDIQNETLFLTIKREAQPVKVNKNVPKGLEQEVVATIIDDVLLKPFFLFLSKMIRFGMDPNGKVQKYKLYRDREIDRLDPEKAEKIEKEEEKEEKLVKRAAFPNQVHKEETLKYLGEEAIKRREMAERRKRQYNHQGLYTAWHMACHLPLKTFIDFLVEEKVQCDEKDF